MAMQRGIKVALAAVLALAACKSVMAQEPLRVEVVSTAPHQKEPILVRITNLTTKELELVLPKYGASLATDPLDIERRNGKKWTEIALAFAGPKPKGSPKIQPGETIERQFGVIGAGDYRVRVWYVASPPSLGPPLRSPKYASVISASFRVD